MHVDPLLPPSELGISHFPGRAQSPPPRSEEHTSELQSRSDLVCRLLLEKKKTRSLALMGMIAALSTITMFITLLIPCHTIFFFFFFNDTATTEIYTLSLHDALPILCSEG